MRGTRQLVGWRTPESGIIPAYAGNTRAQPASLPANWDHPRVCGEHSTSSKPPDVMSGSSPRMRGTRSWRDCRAARAGIIPAYAGNTCPSTRAKCSTRGIIPAYAGNTITLSAMHEAYWDHPRVCGEHATGASTQVNCTGSSPRMRGTPAVTEATNNTARIIPAYAGNTPAACWKSWQAWDHPRVCGEHQSCLQRIRLSRGSSPRMRGTLRGLTLGLDSPGIIPAYAGNTDH